MEPITFHSIVVDRCTNCEGIWFPDAEHKELKKMRGSQVIDTGSPEVGKKYDRIEQINCPVCGKTMEHVPDTYKPHIHFEHCLKGHGTFFDAGEFKDYKGEKLSDFFRDLSMYFHRGSK